MKTRILGKSGLAVSEIGLGCWQLGGDFGPIETERAEAVLAAAQRNGITFWDTADVYGGGRSEQTIAAYRAANPGPAVVATKVGRTAELYPDGYTRETLRAAIECSRERLRVDALDLVQLHCIPFEELGAGRVFDWLEAFRAEGLIRHYGASVETLEEARFCVEETDVTTVQLILNLFRQDATEELLDRAKDRQIGIIARLPLASGLLSGRMTSRTTFAEQDHRHFNRDGATFNVGETFSGLRFETGLALVERLRTYVPEGYDLPGMALRWVLDQPAVTTVIAGASRPEQVATNAAASGLAPLPGELHQRLRRFYDTEVRPHVRGAI